MLNANTSEHAMNEEWMNESGFSLNEIFWLTKRTGPAKHKQIHTNWIIKT